MVTNRTVAKRGGKTPEPPRPAPLAAEFLADVKGLHGLGGSYPKHPKTRALKRPLVACKRPLANDLLSITLSRIVADEVVWISWVITQIELLSISFTPDF